MTDEITRKEVVHSEELFKKTIASVSDLMQMLTPCLEGMSDRLENIERHLGFYGPEELEDE
jgi:hypothetical protein